MGALLRVKVPAMVFVNLIVNFAPRRAVEPTGFCRLGLFPQRCSFSASSLVAISTFSPSFTRLTATAVNLAVYSRLGIFIVFPPNFCFPPAMAV